MKRNVNRASQSGVMLIEALVGMLIFLIGIMALMGMQAASISNTSQAKYRSEASLFASQIISQMWADPSNLATYAYTSGSSGNANVNAWVSRISNSLPGTDTTTNPPTIGVVMDPAPIQGATVTVTVNWRGPNEPAGTLHNFITVTRVVFN